MVFPGEYYRLVFSDNDPVTSFRVWYCANPTRSISGKTDASHAKNANGTISVYYGTLGSESDIGENITARNRYANLGSSKWVECDWKDGSGGWVITTGECS